MSYLHDFRVELIKKIDTESAFSFDLLNKLKEMVFALDTMHRLPKHQSTL